jgi:hypothetical protein
MKQSLTRYNTGRFYQSDCFNKPDGEPLRFEDPHRDEALTDFAEVIRIGRKALEEEV